MLTVQDPVLDLAHSLRAAQIDPAIQAISGSPMTGQQAKLAYVPYGRPEDLLRFQSQASLSPTKKEMLTDMFRNPSTQSSPGSDRLKHIQGSPSWRQSAMPGDDVFVSGVQVHVGNSHQQGKSYHPAHLLTLR